MPYYAWQGMNQQGRSCSGSIEASSEGEVSALLLSRRIALTSLQEKKAKKIASFFFLKKNVSLDTFAEFFDYCGTLLDSGIDLVGALKSCEEYFKRAAMSGIIRGIILDIARGKKLHEAFGVYEKMLPGHTSALLAAAEQTGRLGEMFLRIAAQVKEQRLFQARIKKALLTPCVTLAFACVITFSIILIVVPQLEVIIKQTEGSIPRATQILFSLSTFLRSYEGVVMLSVGFILFLSFLHFFQKSIKVRSLTAQLPLLGTIISTHYLISFLHSLELFLDAGIPLADGLRMMHSKSKSFSVKVILTEVIERLVHGEALHDALQRHGAFFPATVVTLVQVGSSTGRLSDVIAKARFLQARLLHKKLDLFILLINPLAVIILGIMVIGVLLAVYVPIFTMATVVR